MKKFQFFIYPAIFVCLFVLSVSAQKAKPSKVAKFDAKLAKRLGADEYGMKKYVMAFLQTGKADVSKDEREKLQTAHLKNIIRLADEGKLIIAGPFLDDRNIRGIYIFNVETIEEARKLTETDPAVKAGVFEFELRPWYGSAALLEVTRIHKTVEKKSVAP